MRDHASRGIWNKGSHAWEWNMHYIGNPECVTLLAPQQRAIVILFGLYILYFSVIRSVLCFFMISRTCKLFSCFSAYIMYFPQVLQNWERGKCFLSFMCALWNGFRISQNGWYIIWGVINTFTANDTNQYHWCVPEPCLCNWSVSHIIIRLQHPSGIGMDGLL